jgi:hypothetical protein
MNYLYNINYLEFNRLVISFYNTETPTKEYNRLYRGIYKLFYINFGIIDNNNKSLFLRGIKVDK